MTKRRLALALVLLVVTLVVTSILVLRTRWAGDRICAAAAARLSAAAGQPIVLAGCQVEPLTLTLDVEGLRLGPEEAPVFAADAASVRLAPVQALGARLVVDRVRLVRPRLSIRAPTAPRGAPVECPGPVASRVLIRQLDVEDGALDVGLPAGRLRIGGLRVTGSPGGVRATLRALAGGAPSTRLRIEAGTVALEGARRTLALSAVSAEAEVASDLSRADLVSSSTTWNGVRLSAFGPLGDPCRPELDLAIRGVGPIPRILELAGAPDERWAGDGDAVLRLVGAPPRLGLSGEARVAKARHGRLELGEGRAKFHYDAGKVHVDSLEVDGATGRVTGKAVVRVERGLPAQIDLEVGGLDPAEILSRVGVKGAWVTGRLDGAVSVTGTLSPLDLAGTATTTVADFRALHRSWELAQPGEPAYLDVPQARVAGRVHLTPARLTAEGASIEAGRGRVGVDVDVGLTPGAGFTVRYAGAADLDVLRHLAQIPLGGMLQAEGTIGMAPPGAHLRAAARVRVEGFRFLDVDLGHAAADLTFADFVMRLGAIEGARSQTRYRGEAAIDLRRAPVQILSSRWEAKGRLRDLFDAVLDWIPKVRYARDALDGDVELVATAAGPAGAPDATFDARLGVGTFYGRAFESGRLEGRLTAGNEAFFERAELKREGGWLRARGRWGFAAPFPWGLDVSWAGLPMDALALPGGAWSGSSSGSARLDGSLGDPRIRFSGSGDAVAVEGARIGAVQVGGTVDGARVTLTGTAEGLRFAGEARLDGRQPFEARADVALLDAERLVPGAPPPLRLRAAGAVRARGDLADLAASHVSAELESASLGYADFRVETAGKLVAEYDRRVVTLRPVKIRGLETEMDVSGGVRADGQLDFDAEGHLDLRLTGGVFAQARAPNGRLDFLAHVAGPLGAPVLIGTGRLEGAGFTMRSVPMTFTGLTGDLAFSQNRVIFDRLDGAANGGRARLRGEVELERLLPSTFRVEAEADQVPVAMPAWLPATLSGRLELAGRSEAMALTGRLHVVRARYTENVDMERSLVEIRRRVAAPRAYDKEGERLRMDVQLVVDGDARIDNDLMRATVRGEVSVVGTAAAYGVLGSVTLAEGSRAFFRGNEFDLTHAVVDFTERDRIAMALDVHGQAQVRDYDVFMHLFGPFADPQLTLTSTPALSQPDIVTLLSLGFTTKDAAAGTGVQGAATAAAAQALMSASGLDEQVRRFLPRGGAIRDASVRITSAYSEGSGQVEPRAEFESWLWRDRLRLRYQAPLSGARGQRAQAEFRLGRHTAVQYQWDNDNPDVPAGDHGVDLKLRWEWTD
ncbi:MAG TPA: translocation/assembly module TamB domain-containing protein [Anaeromyxobacteraceae bacterium]|nr:translocation/assembly module TamB domain-containing protein [Anaeromyxobacteraceae bacterium]